jgi:hypothetical protein
LQDQTPYQENFEGNNSVGLVTNKETMSEVITDTCEPVPVVNDNESVPALIHNESIDNHSPLINSDKVDNLKEITNKNAKDSGQEIHSVFAKDTEAESFVNSIETEKIEPTVVESIPADNEVNVNKVITTTDEPQNELTNHCKNEEEKEVSSASVNDTNTNLHNEERDSEGLLNSPEKVKENSEAIAETINDTKIVTNSDDVAVLTEFNSMEYNTQLENPERQEEEKQNHSKSIIIEDKTDIKAEAVVKAEEKEENQLTEKKLDNSSTEFKDNKQTDDQVKEIKDGGASMNDELPNENVEEEEEEDEDLELHLSTQSTENHRKVIQDIFDDWQDENGEDDNNQSSAIFKDNHDSVEMELQSLLDDGAQQEQSICSSNSTEQHSVNSNENCKNKEPKSDAVVGKTKVLRSEKTSVLNKSNPDSKSPSNKSQKSVTNYIPLKGEFVILYRYFTNYFHII